MAEHNEFRAGDIANEERKFQRGGEERKLTYFLIGFGLGAVGALLFSPRCGKEIREAITAGAFLLASKLGKELREEVAKTTQRGYETAHEIADELTEAGREMAATFVEEAKEIVAQSTERLSEVIEVGKQAYMEEKRKAEAGEK